MTVAQETRTEAARRIVQEMGKDAAPQDVIKEMDRKKIKLDSSVVYRIRRELFGASRPSRDKRPESQNTAAKVTPVQAVSEKREITRAELRDFFREHGTSMVLNQANEVLAQKGMFATKSRYYNVKNKVEHPSGSSKPVEQGDEVTGTIPPVRAVPTEQTNGHMTPPTVQGSVIGGVIERLSKAQPFTRAAILAKELVALVGSKEEAKTFIDEVV